MDEERAIYLLLSPDFHSCPQLLYVRVVTVL